MRITIFGKEACPFCTKAKELSEELKSKNSGIEYVYIDIHKEGITKADLQKTIGHEVSTVPQIFIDKEYIGGYREFANRIEGMNL